jgi:hypothetical protein
MHRFWPIFVAGLLAVGCRSTDTAAILAHSPWEENTKPYLDSFKHVLVVCVYQDHWEDCGPHRYSQYHFKATVVRSYKGEWKIGDRVALVHGVDAPAISVTNGVAGYLVFVFTNEHTDAEIAVDTGEFANYSPELDAVIQCVFPERRHK